MKLYHGSDTIIREPIYGFGKEDNDYGSGFYMTDNAEMAAAWAVANGRDSAFCNAYELPIEDMDVLYLDQYGTLTWIAEVISHRGVDDESYEFLAQGLIEKYKVDTEGYDVIVGYRADDSYMQVTDAFLKGNVSIDEVDRFFREGKLGEQICIKSKEAFNAIRFTDAKEIHSLENYENYDEAARKRVQKFLREREYAIQVQRFQPAGLTIWDVLDTRFVFDPDTNYYQPEDTQPEGQDFDDEWGL